jgi:hypothetical protein
MAAGNPAPGTLRAEAKLINKRLTSDGKHSVLLATCAPDHKLSNSFSGQKGTEQ